MIRSIEEIEDNAIEAAVEDSIFLRLINFGLRRPDGFTYDEIIHGLRLVGWEKVLTESYLDNAFHNNVNSKIPGRSTNIETPFFGIQINKLQTYQHETCKYIINFEAQFKYLDYQELKFARENARDAKKLSVIAIIISMLTMLVSAAIPFWVASQMTQTIKIDNDQISLILASTTKPEAE